MASSHFYLKENQSDHLAAFQIGSRDAVERSSDDVASVHDSASYHEPEIKQEPEEDEQQVKEETFVGQSDKGHEPKPDFEDDFDNGYDSDDEHHLCSTLLYFILKTLLHHSNDSPQAPNMDRFAEQFLGRPDRDPNSRSRPPDNSGFMETFAKNLAKSAARSAAKRAMGESSSGNRSRDRPRGGGGFGEISPEDFRGLGNFVLEMLGGKNEEEAKERGEKKRDKKRKRDKDRDRDRDGTRSRKLDEETDRYGSDRERRKRRRRRVTFAEPYYEPQREDNYPPPY
ncbi:hypothetical protein FZEAL_10245, partial [Fusarium zealandicum]